jgi:quercetin dioxygenase-like cupin family protein
MRKTNLFEAGTFKEKGFGKLLVHDSPYFKILNFNFEPGQELPIHSHDLEGQLSITVIEGEGEFLADGGTMPARTGDVLVADIAEPHGVRAATRMRVLVTIAPPI